MNTYVCTPKRRDRKARVICLVCLMLSVAAMYLCSLFPLQKAPLQFLSVLSLLTVVWISTKFILTNYCYRLEGTQLSLSCRQGKRIKSLGILPLNEPFVLLSAEQWKQRKKEFPLRGRYFFCQNLSPKDPCYFLRPDEGKYILVVLEADETLFSLLQEYERKKD